MFDIGLSELLLIAVVALVVVGPKDLPVVIRHVMKFLRELRGLYAGIKTQMHQVMKEAGVDDMMHETTTIIDLEGKPQQAYNVNDLALLEQPKPQNSSPLAGEDRWGGVPQAHSSNRVPLTPTLSRKGRGSDVEDV